MTTIRPILVASYIEMFGKARQEDGSPFSPPTIKQHLAAIKMVLIWMRLESVTIQKRPYSARRAAAPHSSPKKG